MYQQTTAPGRGLALAALVLVVFCAPGLAATRTRTTPARVRCVGTVTGGVAVQVEPARKGVSVTVRSVGARKSNRAKTDVAGRARVPGTFGAVVQASAGTGKLRTFRPSPCLVSITAIAPNAFTPISAPVKGRAPLTLGFGTGEIVVPGGALNSGTKVSVMRAPKTIVPGDAGTRSVSVPIDITTSDNSAPTAPFIVSLVAPLPPTESGAPSLRVYYLPAGQTTTQELPVQQSDLVATVAVPGLGTVEAALAPGVTLPPQHPLDTGINVEEPPVETPAASTPGPVSGSRNATRYVLSFQGTYMWGSDKDNVESGTISASDIDVTVNSAGGLTLPTGMGTATVTAQQRLRDCPPNSGTIDLKVTVGPQLDPEGKGPAAPQPGKVGLSVIVQPPQGLGAANPCAAIPLGFGAALAVTTPQFSGARRPLVFDEAGGTLQVDSAESGVTSSLSFALRRR